MSATRANAHVSPTGPGTTDTLKSYKNDRKFIHRSVRENSKGPIYEPLPCVQNGYYQQIVWLGVAGYMVVNHFDKDIVLVDPWPTYRSWWVDDIPLTRQRPLFEADQETFDRLQDLVNFLRFAHEDGYRVSAILLSHVHFDHTEDVPIILEMLSTTKKVNVNTDFFEKKHNKEKHITLLGTSFTPEELPTIVCDFDTMIYLKTQYFGVPRETLIGPQEGGDFDEEPTSWIPKFPSGEKVPMGPSKYGYWYGKEHLQYIGDNWLRVSDKVRDRYGTDAAFPESKSTAWREIKHNKQRLFYDDCFNHKVFKTVYPKSPIATPAVKVDTVKLDRCSFEIQPYIWDHMNASAAGKSEKWASENQAAVGLQRISAFMLSRKLDYGGMVIKYAKKTFFVGSGGEMNEKFTKPAPEKLKAPIKTDVLIQAMMGNQILPGKGGWLADVNLPELMSYCREYTYQNIEVADYLIWGHYEEFVRWIATYKKGDLDKQYIERGFKLAYGDNIKVLKHIIDTNNNIPDANKEIFTEKKLLALGRMGSNSRARVAEYYEDSGINKQISKTPAEFEKPMPLSVMDLRKMIKDALDNGYNK